MGNHGGKRGGNYFAGPLGTSLTIRAADYRRIPSAQPYGIDSSGNGHRDNTGITTGHTSPLHET